MAPGFSEIDRRNTPRDGTYSLYLRTPIREPNVIQQRLSIFESHKRTARFYIAVLQSKASGDGN
jgi:hypothetical protein